MQHDPAEHQQFDLDGSECAELLHPEPGERKPPSSEVHPERFEKHVERAGAGWDPVPAIHSDKFQRDAERAHGLRGHRLPADAGEDEEGEDAGVAEEHPLALEEAALAAERASEQ